VLETNKHLNDRILELYTLYNVSKSLSTTLDLDKIFEITMDLFKESFHVDEYSLMLLDEDSQELKIKASYGLSDKIIHKVTYKFGEDVPGLVLQTGETMIIKDVSKETKFHYYKGMKKDLGAFLSIPLKSGDEKEVLGVLNVHKPTPNSFVDKDVDIFSSIASHIAIAVDKARIHQKTVEISITDELTKIYNRRYFNERYQREVQRSQRYQRMLSVIMIDIDYFKVYNDKNGHLKGDNVLKTVAKIIKNSVRGTDLVARFGGEEFVVFLPETNKTSAIDVAEKLRKNVLKEKFENEESQPNGQVSISLGVANFPVDSQNAGELLELADKSLYKAKYQGRNQVCAFSPNA
jgi:diguanylate cyclase (GGDEF)-like protein